MMLIKLVDARKGLHEKCIELLHDEKVAESIYMYLCDGLEECDVIEPERKTGRWIAEPNCWYRCSDCGAHYPSIRRYMDYKFCPRCGADMMGEGGK